MNTGNEKGFTLIEILVAVGILGAIMGLVAGSYYSATLATRHTEERLELLSMGRVALDRIILEINGAYVDALDATKYPFVGEHGGGWKDPQDKLTFYTMSFDPQPLGAGSNAADISYYLEKNPNLDTYFLQHRMNPYPSPERKEGGIISDLAEQVLGLKFRYEDENESWSDRWDSTVDGKLPRLVEITIILQGKGDQSVQLRGEAAPRRWVQPKI